MSSQDFHWVVLAIRVQREVGGNLAEVLTKVAATLRERERLRRQVQVLSAEGRLSAVIIALIPILFAVFLLIARPTYLEPLYTTSIGLLMLGFGLLMLVVGNRLAQARRPGGGVTWTPPCSWSSGSRRSSSPSCSSSSPSASLNPGRSTVGRSLAAVEAMNSAPKSMVRAELEQPFGERVFGRLFERLAGGGSRLTPAGQKAGSANASISPETPRTGTSTGSSPSRCSASSPVP